MQPQPDPSLLETPQRITLRDARPRGFRWATAARMMVQDKTTEEIAQSLGVSQAAVRNWKRNPLFQQLHDRYQKRIDRETIEVGIAVKNARLRSISRRYNRLQNTISARALDALHPDSPLHGIPGADQGVLVAEDYEIIGEGENAKRLATKVKYDAALFKEIRELEVQAAKEMGGQFEESKSPLTALGLGVNISVSFPTMTAEEANKAIAAAPVIDLPMASKRQLR